MKFQSLFSGKYDQFVTLFTEYNTHRVVKVFIISSLSSFLSVIIFSLGWLVWSLTAQSTLLRPCQDNFEIICMKCQGLFSSKNMISLSQCLLNILIEW